MQIREPDPLTADDAGPWADRVERLLAASAPPEALLEALAEAMRERRSAAVGESIRRLESALLAAFREAAVSPPTLETFESILERERTSLREALSVVDVSAAAQSEMLLHYRSDLDVWERLSEELTGEARQDPLAAVDVRLGGAARVLEEAVAAGEPGASGPLERCRRLHRAVWERQAARETRPPEPDADVASLWRRRFRSSRLESEISPDDDWRPRLDETRRRLADAASAAVSGLGDAERSEVLRALVVEARGEANELFASLLDHSLERGVRRLELAVEDFERVAQTADDAPRPADALAAERWRDSRRIARQLARRARNELQELDLARRLEDRFGARTVRAIETASVVFILLITALIGVEWAFEKAGLLTPAALAFFAWADLFLCAGFLAEFVLKFSFVRGRARYFLRHFVVDVLPAVPVGFLTHYAVAVEHTAAQNLPALLRFLRFLRLPILARYLRAARPFLRFGRLVVFGLRLTDEMVRRHAGLLNRNILLFSAERPDADEHRHQHLVRSMKELWSRGAGEVFARLSRVERVRLASLELLLAEESIGRAGDQRPAPFSTEDRHIPVETVIEQLLEMTPERLVERMGRPFAESVQRYAAMLDLPLLRRLPVARELVAHRRQPAPEVAALAANQLGYVLQTLLDGVYFVVDLQATMTAPMFLDRLGTTLVVATKRPAVRLLLFGAIVMVLSVLVWPIPLLGPVVQWIDEKLVRPIVLLGLLCLLPLAAGLWLRRLANQAAEYSERVVEAQFAAQTKRVKRDHREQDEQFLHSRVIQPELALRAADDLQLCDGRRATTAGDLRIPAGTFREEERLFLRSIDLLYQDYLDGSLFHRSDTKTTTQLLGNLALVNLRQSSLAHWLADNKRLAAIDLSRSGSIFGGPYLWFNYITRGITQSTARLLVDYNRHAVPMARLACSSRHVRERFRDWLAGRLEVAPAEIELPAPVGRYGDDDVRPAPNRRAQADDRFETVDFMAIDFLTEDAARDGEIRAKYGRQLAALLARDRQENVRRAFGSLPLHRIPKALRTINPYVLYETHLSGGRILLLPLLGIWWIGRLLVRCLLWVRQVVLDLLEAKLRRQVEERSDSYAVARRKIHRMRKPMFMQSLWLRARFDVEYAGLTLPGLEANERALSELEGDLGFIGATRRERLAADRLFKDHRVRLGWAARWLARAGFDYRSLPSFLAAEFPYLADRSAEVLRALVTAFMLDHDDVFTLAGSIEGVGIAVDWTRDPARAAGALPGELPPSVSPSSPRWYRRRKLPRGRRERVRRVLDPGVFRFQDEEHRQRAEAILLKNWPAVRGWVDVLLTQGGGDAEATLRGRLAEVIRRTDLWSDQIIALRTIQSLTMLDVYHYCEMVWKLGGFAGIEGRDFTTRLPARAQGLPAPSGESPAAG